MFKPMTEEQLHVLQGYLDAAEAGVSHIDQIHFLSGGNISKQELVVVTVQHIDGKWWRYIDIIDPEGRTSTRECELKDVEIVRV